MQRAVASVIDDNRRKAPSASMGDKLDSLADVVQAMAAFDRDGHIQLDFDEDDEQYDISAMREQARQREQEAAQLAHRNSRDESRPVPELSVCIMIVGTRGDVQPFIAVAKHLQDDGHRVRLATHAVYRDFVMEHGVEFYPLGGDPKELAAYMVKTGGHLIPLKFETLQKDVPRNMQMIEEILYSTWPAVSAADPDGGGPGVPGKPFQAQAIISNPVTYGHIHVAERLGVPLHIMFPQPWVPTEQFPHPLSNLAYTWKPQRRNYMSYKLVDLLMWQGTERMINEFRTEELGLRKIRKGDGGREILLDLGIPHAFMWSPHLVPKPADWGPLYDVIGTVTLKQQASKYTPTPELEAFLGSDGGPIFVGFGSMVLQDPLGVTNMIISAAEQAKVRVLIQSSWSDMAGGITVPDNVFFLGNCPHDWLMPRVSAVVHHGGAGTTAAGLLAGKPTFIVPFFGDQPFWGRAVVVAGVGVEPCPISKLTTEVLRSVFEEFKNPELHHRAQELRDEMLQEDGVEGAVSSFYRHLPLQQMQCDLGCGRLATKWSQKDKIKLCDQCEFVITARPENTPDDIVAYHSVDYSGRGPNSALEGASAGAGAFLHELGSGVKDMFIKPTQGYREEGAKGAVIGIAKGIGGFLISPIQGAAVFVDHVATGRHNQRRGSVDRKKATVLFENRKLRNAIGLKAMPEVHTGAMNPDEMINVDRRGSNTRQVAVQLSPEERQTMEANFYEISAQRLATGGPVADEQQPVHQRFLKKAPTMNICMITTGSWEESVQQFVAVGLRLKADGHRVRIATNGGLRDRIVGAGLEFYPLGGRATTTGKFLQYIHERMEEEQRNKSKLFNFARSKFHGTFPEIDDLKELVFSLWPACVEVDPLAPGRAFRADAIISHPYMFGQTTVAERLGVPLHCMSYNPQSRTQAFPHLMSANLKLYRPYRLTPSNIVSYEVVSNLLWNGMKSVLDDFRYFLGLDGKTVAANLLAEWHIPHTYLWNPELLPKPHDWGSEITVAGYVELQDLEEWDEEAMHWREELCNFAAIDSRPMIYFGFIADDSNPHQVKELVASIDKAARKARVRVVFQCFGNPGAASTARDTVLEIDQDFPVKRIMDFVNAAVHWGDLSITSTCLTAEKPACVVPRNVTQRLWGQALALAGAGIEPLDLDALSPNNLVHVFSGLMDPRLTHVAKRMAATFSKSKAVEAAVSAFYKNLPVEGMTCDLDPTRIARIYDPVNQLKLSYEAHLVVRQLTSDEQEDLKYKPLQYSMRHAPRLSLRHLKSDALRGSYSAQERTDAYAYSNDLFKSVADVQYKVITAKKPQPAGQRRSSLARYQSVAVNVVEAPEYWLSPDDRALSEKTITEAYESLIRARKFQDGASSSVASSVSL